MKRLLCVLLLFCATSLYAQDLTTRLDGFLDQYATERGFRGTVMVAEEGKLLYARGFGLADPARGLQHGPQVQYRVASVTKSFTAAIIMKLVEEGKIALSDPITKYLPGYRHDTGDRITIHHLLTHSSGIPDYANRPDARERGSEPMPALEQMIEKYCSDSLAFEPGSKFSYCNSGYMILGAIIQKVTGQTYDKAVRSMLLDPAGMSNSGIDCSGLTLPARAPGFDAGFGDTLPAGWAFNVEWVSATGGLYATPEDMVKWDIALADPAFISRNALRLMQTSHIRQRPGGPGYGYGLMLDRRTRSRRGDSLMVVYHPGSMSGVSSVFARVPATRQMVFIVSNVSGAPVMPMCDGVLALLNGNAATPVRPSLVRALHAAIASNGVQEGVRTIESEHLASPARHDASENEFGILGHQYLREKKNEEAASVFAYALRLFPRSAGAFNNMGECADTMGQKEKAIGFYRKSLELNPAGTVARDALRKLGAN
jgi:CubicO group peptidase (beta-lactamase class C family)